MQMLYQSSFKHESIHGINSSKRKRSDQVLIFVFFFFVLLRCVEISHIFLLRRYRSILAPASSAITITLPDGSKRDGMSHVTTPLDIATAISPGLARNVLIAEVDGKVWDLSRPLEASCSLKLLKFEDPKGQYGNNHHLYLCLSLFSVYLFFEIFFFFFHR